MPDRLFKHPQWIVCVAAALAFLASACLSYERRDGMLSGDEMAYRFQARIFASGHWVAPVPPGAASGNIGPPHFQFAHHLITARGWYGVYPVGWPLLLALGAALNADWLVNPLVGTLLIWLTWRLARISFSDDDVAVCAVLFLFPCPFFFINTSGEMSHAFAACAVTAALCFAEAGLARRSAPVLAAAIALIGLCLCIRPFTAIAASVAVGAVILFRLGRDRLLLRLIPWALAVSILVLALAAAQNHYQTGSYLKSAYALYAGKARPEEISFDLRAILAASPRETAASLASTVFNSTPFIFLLSAFAWFQPSIPRGKAALLAGVFTASVLLYTLDMVQNVSLPGQRMYFEGLPGLAVLAAAGLRQLRQKWNIERDRTVRALVFLGAVQLTQFVLVARDVQIWIQPAADLHAVLRNAPCTNCVVFMRSENATPSDGLAPRNFNVNSPDWPHAPHLYLIDPGPALRDEVTRELGRPQWALVTYDGAFGTSFVQQIRSLTASHPSSGG